MGEGADFEHKWMDKIANNNENFRVVFLLSGAGGGGEEFCSLPDEKSQEGFTTSILSSISRSSR